MTYLLLPSNRLALYLAEQKRAKILPIRAEQYLLHAQQGHSFLATTFYKSFAVYNQEDCLKNQDVKPITSVQFNKKLQGLVSNNSNSFYVSDKFGDVYAISTKGEQKYLNSNLGIPTFLKHIKGSKRSYLLVGDEDTRIKIYNEARMHEIISFWFIARRVPLLLVQPRMDTLVLMVKKQSQINLQMQEDIDQLVQLYQLGVNHLEDQQFNGKLFFVSREIHQEEECKYQNITYSATGDLYLLKLFASNLQIVLFRQVEGLYKQVLTRTLSLSKGDWDYLYANHQSDQLIIAYGKTTLIDEKAELMVEESQLKAGEDNLQFKFNQNEHLIVLQL